MACDVVMEKSDHPYEAIVNVAEHKGCDLIMMASHGRRGVGALLLGSETQKVLTHSKIPVLVYREQTRNQKEVNMFKHILLPTDGSELSAEATHQGILFAKSIRAKVTGLCVMPLHGQFRYSEGIPTEALGGSAEQCKELAEAYLSTIERELR